MAFLSNAPIWVWPLFLALLFLGLRSTRTRRVPVALIVALPFLGLLSLRNLAGLNVPSLVWPLWAVAVLLGALAGHALQKRWLIRREGAFAQVKGEWLTLIVVMLIFWSNFVFGAVEAAAPGLKSGPAFVIPMALILGACAGSFAGRAIRILRA